MNIRIFSKQQLELFIEEGHYDKIAVISFYEPSEKPVSLPDEIKKLFIKASDSDRDTLKQQGISYGSYLPEADEIASFIIEAYKADIDIVCQCRYGQSMSAGCAAAIREYFDKNGISIFSDYRYCPNQIAYNKIYNALGRTEFKQSAVDSEAYFFSRPYKALFNEKHRCAGTDYSDLLDFLEDAEEIISDKYGRNNTYIADIQFDRGSVLSEMKQFEIAAHMYEKAAELYSKSGNTRYMYYSKEQLAKMLVRCGKNEEAVKTAQSIIQYNVIKAEFLLAHIYIKTGEYSRAINALRAVSDISTKPYEKVRAIREMGRIYYNIGEKETAAAYLSESYKLLTDIIDKERACTSECKNEV